MHRFLLLLLAALVSGAALADDPEQSAKVERGLDKAKEEVAKKYGNKKVEEMSADERRQRAHDESAAAEGVFEKHGTDAKSYERSRQKMNQGQQAEVRSRADALKAKEEAEAKKGKPDEVVVEKGLPPEEEARMMDEKLNAGGGKKKGKRR